MNNLENINLNISFEEVLESIQKKAISSSTHILNAVKKWQSNYENKGE